MTKPDEWVLTPTGTKAHILPRGVYDGRALCGCIIPDSGWIRAEDKNTMECCLRCLKLSQAETEVPPEAVERNISVNFLQTVGEMVPVCNLSVLDLEGVIQLLKTLKPTGAGQDLLRGFVDLTVYQMQKKIDEAKERANRPTSTTFTYHHPEK